MHHLILSPSGEIIFSIQKAHPEDLDVLYDIECSAFGHDSFSRAQFAYLIKKAKGITYAARHNHSIVGYLSLLTNAHTHRARIYSIAVRAEVRGQRIAQRLIDEAIAFAKTEKMKVITLEVNVTNSAAIHLYQKNGFVITGRRAYYYSDGNDAHLMQRAL